MSGFWFLVDGMYCLIVYDIESDRVRTKVADICLDYGLTRIQESVFLGELTANQQDEVLLKIRRRLGKTVANVQLYPICEKDLRLRRVIQAGTPTKSKGAE